MKIKVFFFALAFAFFGGVLIVKLTEEKPRPKSAFFKNSLKDIKTNDGKTYWP